MRARPRSVIARHEANAHCSEMARTECSFAEFVPVIRNLLDRSTPLVATVALSGSGFIAAVKPRPDVELWQVTAQNRDVVPTQLAERITSAIGGPSDPRDDSASS